MDDKLLQGESKFIEYKQSYTKTLLKTVSAFSNYHDGYIVIGLNDAGELIGVEGQEETRLSIENAINDSIEPKPFYEFYSEAYEGKSLVILKVYKGDYTPYTFNQKAYKRMDTATVQVDKHAYEELILQGRNISFEELPCEDQSLEELPCEDQSLEFKLLESKLRHTLNIHELSDDLLITMGLKGSGKYNNVAALFADENPIDSSGIQLIAYTDDSVLKIKDRHVLKHISVLKQYEDCIDFYRKHINIGEVIDGPYRKTIEEVPLVAYREAIANAIVHRDYSRKIAARIEVFSDRIEILSPGSLPIGLSEEEYYEGRISVSRNRVLADIFLRLKIIEKLATGVRRIKEYYRNSDRKPKFIVSENSILVILPKIRSAKNIAGQADLNRLDRLTKKERQLYEAIKAQGTMRRVEIEKELGLKKTQTIEIINNLRNINLIAQIGNGRATKYILKP